jgi:hypothetical protein
MNRRGMILGILLAAALSSPLPGRAQDDISRVVGVGTAEIGAESKSAAGHKAFDQAMQDAVLQVIRQRVPEAALTTAQAQIQEKILSRANAFVRNYQTLEEKTVAGSVTVRVQADVWAESVNKDLTALGITQVPAASQDKTVRLTVTQPDRYRKVAALRKFLQEEAPSVGRVFTVELNKKHVILEVSLKKEASPEQLRRELAAKSFDGRTPKVTRAADDRLDVDL